MRRTRLPKSPKALEDHIQALTRRIDALSAHIAAHVARNFHDNRARWRFQALIQRRGQALECLKPLDPEVHQRLTVQIKQRRDE